MKRSLIISTGAISALAIGLNGFGGLVYAQTPPPAAQARPDRGHDRAAPPPMGRMMLGPGRPGGPFGLLEFDANGDGKLTRAEFDGALRSRFNDIDANKDGVITRAEIGDHRPKARADAEAARFQIMDSDHNGQISKAEFEAASKNRQGDDRPPMRGPRGHRGPGFGGPGAGHPGRPHPGQNPADAGQMRQGGPDAEARIDFAEFSRGPAEAFSRADLNKDSVVTIAELQTLSKAMR